MQLAIIERFRGIQLRPTKKKIFCGWEPEATAWVPQELVEIPQGMTQHYPEVPIWNRCFSTCREMDSMIWSLNLFPSIQWTWTHKVWFTICQKRQRTERILRPPIHVDNDRFPPWPLWNVMKLVKHFFDCSFSVWEEY